MSKQHHSRLYRIVSLLVFAGLLFGLWGGGGATAASPGHSAGDAPVTGETFTLEPAGQMTWDEMVAYEASHPAEAVPATPREIPWMPAPAPRPVDGLPAAPTGGQPHLDLQSPEGVQGAGLLVANFAALGDNNTSIPPDTMGAVGPNHLMTMLNTQVRIQQKNGTVLSTVSLNTFWTSGTGLSGNPFDPHLIYDSLTGRWIATVDANPASANSAVWVAISDGSDPTGTWSFYGWDVDSTDTYWADYPGLGVNTNWVAIINNMFSVASNSYGGPQMWVIDKSSFGNPTLTVTAFPRGFDNTGSGSSFTLKPALTFDAAEQTLYIVDGYWSSGGTRAHRVSQITDSSGTPVWSLVGYYVVANNYDPAQVNASQLGTGTRILTNDIRILNAVFRNGHLWLTHTGGLPVGAVDRTAVFWYEVDPTTPSIVQSGVIDGGADVHHYFPSISVNQFDEVLIGFTRSDSTRYAEAVFVTRQPTDPAGWSSLIQVVRAGQASYVKDFGSGRVRWGDYSATAVDPSDDQTLWTLQEYAEMDVGPNSFDDRWGTWWGAVQFYADVGITKTITFGTYPNLTYNITVNNNGSADATGVTVQDNLPSQLTYLSDDCGAGAPAGNIWNWNAPDVTAGGATTCHLTVSLASGVTGWVVNMVNVAADQIDNNSWNDSATVAFSVPQAVSDTYTVSEDQSIGVLAPGVLANDQDLDGDPLTAVLDTGVSHGSLTLQSDGGFYYTPDPDFNGIDTFTYYASDGNTHSPTTTVTLTITPVNDPPIALDDAYTTEINEPLNVPAPGVLANDSDIDMDSLTAVLVSPPISGALTLQPDGAFDFVPALDFTGTVTFTYQADDGMGGRSSAATVTIVVTGNLPNVDAGSPKTSAEGTPISFTGTYTNPPPVSGDLIYWDFGDSANITGTLTPTHTYTDDGIYTVTLIVTNTLGRVGRDTTVVTVTNVTPIVDAGADMDALISETVTLSASFTDPGILDTHTASINWGDGTPPQPGTVNQGTVTGTHVYTTDGNYTVTVSVTDNSGDTGSDTLQITVTTERKIYLPLVIR